MGSGVVAQRLTVSIAEIEYMRTSVTISANERRSMYELIVLAEGFIRQSSRWSAIDEASIAITSEITGDGRKTCKQTGKRGSRPPVQYAQRWA